MTNFQKELFEKDFIFTFELVPRRSVRTKQYQEIIQFLSQSQKENIFQAYTITDNAGGNPALSPIPLGKTVKSFGLEPIIHLSCKDKNRNQLESELLSLDREGLHNILALTGDYPFYGYLGRGKPVFDLDSILLLQMITEMEKGFEGRPPISFFKGAVINPFKLEVSEIWWQYIKLYKKLKSGAYFIITQVGFFPRKWCELKALFDIGLTYIISRFFEDETLFSPEEDKTYAKVPLIGSLIYLTPALLKAIKNMKVPGIILTECILKRLSQTDNFEEEVLEINAKFAVVLKGLGFKGIHLCGFPLNYDKIYAFLEKFYKYEDRWEEFLYEFDGKVVIESKNTILKKEMPCLLKEDFDFSFNRKRSLHFYFNEFFHKLFFDENRFFYPLLEKLARFIDKNDFLKKVFTGFEYFIKKLLFACRECGDCSLWEFNYHCPQSGCAKTLLNGPCGGSIGGYCEVYPFEKRCLFVKAFENAPSKKVLEKFLIPGKSFYIPPRNWDLYKTSSWLNFYLKRDHKALNIKTHK